MSFNSLGLHPTLLRNVSQSGYTKPTLIQQKAIPTIIDGRDVLAAAQTGSGKTAAFVLPLLHRLLADDQGKQSASNRPRVLVLAPTRELAAQIEDNARKYGKGSKIRTTAIFGGVKARPQISALRRGVDLVIATPGRLLDHANNRDIDLSQVQTLVLDEADRMLDMGFIRDIRRIIDLLPKQRQNLMFSATFSKPIRALANDLLRDPVDINVAPQNSAADSVTQKIIFLDKKDKRALLSWLIGSNDWRQVLVFARTKHGSDRLTKQLNQDGLSAAAIHGNKSQGQRTRALDGFKKGKVRVLVATDVAARGIDIDLLPHVINYELPNVPEDYVHRIGRTGRAGETGEALSLIMPEEREHLRSIQKLLGREIPQAEIDPQQCPVLLDARPEPFPSQHQKSSKPRNQNRQRKRSKNGSQQRSANPKNKSGSARRRKPAGKKNVPKKAKPTV